MKRKLTKIVSAIANFQIDCKYMNCVYIAGYNLYLSARVARKMELIPAVFG